MMDDVDGGPGQHVLRRLEPRDIPCVKALCKDCFPIQYSDHWFNYVTSQKVTYTSAIVVQIMLLSVRSFL